MEYRNRGRKLAPESYRWDSIVTLSKLANTCADGDKTKERQIRDTLKRLPIEQRVRPNTLDGGLRSSVLISTGLAWLRGQDYDLAPWQHTLADKAPSEPVRTASEPTIQAGEKIPAVKAKKCSKSSDEAVLIYLAAMARENPNAKHKDLRRLVVDAVKNGDNAAKAHFELWQTELVWKGTKRTISKSTWSEMIKKAKERFPEKSE